MICYHDRTYCQFWLLCKNGHTCDRALTDEVKNDAAEWWGGDDAPICTYGSLSECFVRMFDGVKNEA